MTTADHAEALNPYLRHLWTCAVKPGVIYEMRPECTCTLEAAVDALLESYERMRSLNKMEEAG